MFRDYDVSCTGLNEMGTFVYKEDQLKKIKARAINNLICELPGFSREGHSAIFAIMKCIC